MDNNSKIEIGIINIMPNSVGYHQELLNALSCIAEHVNLHWIRLDSKSYDEQAEPFLAEHYSNYRELVANTSLDALIVTGAPVETLAFEDVYYWQELFDIIQSAIEDKLFTLGICWGGLAIGNVLGLGKINLPEKVFGVYEHQNRSPEHLGFSNMAAELTMPLSIQAQFLTEDVKRQVAEGRFDVVANNEAIDYSVVQSADKQHLLCLGHPEYGATRLLDEWQRDKQKQPDLAPPLGLDIHQPKAVWRATSNQMLRCWIKQIQQQKGIATTSQGKQNTFQQASAGVALESH